MIEYMTMIRYMLNGNLKKNNYLSGEILKDNGRKPFGGWNLK